MIILGHRGGRGPGWPTENSLAAFQRAMDEGADGVELDVRLCATGEAVLLHDRGCERQRFGELTAARLEEALDLLAGRIVNVEVKADGQPRLALVRTVSRIIRRARPAEIVISSFDPTIVMAFGAALPKVPRGMLVGARWALPFPFALRPMIVAAHVKDEVLKDPKMFRGLRVCAWTVNDRERAKQLVAQGAEWIITDNPALLLSDAAADEAPRDRSNPSPARPRPSSE